MSGSVAEGESFEARMESGERREHFPSPQNEPTALEGRGKFQRFKPTILGAIEVTIGIFMTLTVIAYLAVAVQLVIVVVILYWGILVYIPAGGLTIAADRNPTRAKVCAALVMNVLVALSAIAGSVLHFFAAVLSQFRHGCQDCHVRNTEYVMVAASILLFIVSILVVASAAAALCSSRKAALGSSRKPSEENTVV